MEYRAYPMPDDLPDYPSHWQIAAYFDAFVDHFGLRDKITFRTEVVKVEPVPAGRAAGTTSRWGAATRGRPRSRRCAATRTSWSPTGTTGTPRWPEPSFPGAGRSPATQLHAHYYKTPELFAGKRVLVLGIGNSACDIAVESSRTARDVPRDAPRAHIVPKFVFGVPTDHLTDSALARGAARGPAGRDGGPAGVAQGQVTDYGLPKPDHAVLHAT